MLSWWLQAPIIWDFPVNNLSFKLKPGLPEKEWYHGLGKSPSRITISFQVRSNALNVVHAARHSRIQTALVCATGPWTLLVSNLASNARFHQISMPWKRWTFKTHISPLLPQSLKCICTSNFYSMFGRIHSRHRIKITLFTNYIKKSKDLSQFTEIIISMILILPSSQKPYNQI